MKESILCIDTSVEPAIAAVVEFDQGRLQVAAEGKIAHTESTAEEAFLKEWKDRITSCVVIVPTNNYMTLNLELPIDTPKSIAKVIDLEVQDLLPFEIGNYLIQHKVLSKLANGTDVHVSIYPKEDLKEIINWCDKFDIQPAIITTPASAASAIFYLGGQPPDSHKAAIMAHGDKVHLVTWFSGNARTEKVIPISSKSSFSELKQAIVAAEDRYQSKIDEVLILGNHFSVDALKKNLSRPVAKVTLPPEIEDQNAAAILGTIFGQETKTGVILTNLRTREFSFNPSVKELKRLGKILLPYLALILLGWMVFLCGIYFIKERQINKMEQTVKDNITSIIPELSAVPGDELNQLKSEIAKLDQQLNDLNSPATINPLQALTKLASDLDGTVLSVRRVIIKSNKVTLEGATPSYEDVDKFEAKLKSEVSLFCRVKSNTSGAAPGQPDKYSFSLEIWICD